MIMWDRHVGCGGMGEDRLSLNVWTPGVNDNAKRPVMVSFHGGGWATGSGNGPMRRRPTALLGDVGRHGQSSAGELRLYPPRGGRRSR
jgi:carboxylesterase type B